MNDKIKSILKTLGIISLIAIICAGVFYTSYKFFVNKSHSSYEKSIKIEINNINAINNNIVNYIEGDSINKEKLLSGLPNEIENLKKIRSSVNSISPIKKYTKVHNYLEAGLDNNLSLFEEILYIVKNLENMDLDSSLVRLQGFRDDSLNYYSLVNISGTKITLNDKILHLVSNTSYFVTALKKETNSEEIEKSKNREFLNFLNTVSNKFNELDKTYKTNITSARNGIQSYKSVISLIDNNITNINNLEIEITQSSIHENGVDAYKSILKTIRDYKTYLYNLKFAIENEDLLSDDENITIEKIEALYKTPNKEYESVTKQYDIFMKEYEKIKNLIL